MRSMVEEHISAWKDENNGNLPTQILFYRDSVSESQFRTCETEKIEQVRQAYKNVSGTGDVKITFIVVGKRHHTRFFPTYASQTYQTYKKDVGMITSGNTKPGLLVDNTVTNPSPPDFFLQSDIAVQGTARPAHYDVLLDEMGLGSNIPELTLILCTTFGRAIKVVSYASPAYTADRMCERGRMDLPPWTENELGPTWSRGELKKDAKPFTKERFKEWKK